jgi:hypothetical protein
LEKSRRKRVGGCPVKVFEDNNMSFAHYKKHFETVGDFVLVNSTGMDVEYPFMTIRKKGTVTVRRQHRSREHALKFIEVAQKLTK